MSKYTDQQYLKNEQYKDSSNLNARLEIHRRFSTNSYGWFAWIFDTLQTLPKQARVLELGCGPASMWTTCAERIPADWSITLSDLSDGMLKQAEQNLAGLPRSFTFKQIDAQSIPFDDETFDIVIANHMLYYVPDRAKAIKEIRRVLRSPQSASGRSPESASGRSPESASGKVGGHLIATTVGKNHLKEIDLCLKHVSPETDFGLFANLFSLENGLAQLQPYFQQVEMRRYEDNLQITEIEPLMAYIHSGIRATTLSESALAELRLNLEHELQSNGALFVTKDSGLFEAVK